MAFSGIHIVCGNAGNSSANFATQALIEHPVWSFSSASTSGTTSQVTKGSGNGTNVVRVRASVDTWIAFAETAALATTNVGSADPGPRYFIAANTDYDFYVSKNRYLAWAAA